MKRIIPDPALTIKPVTSDGSLLVEFNQKMIAPQPGRIKARNYRRVFVFSIISDIDGKVTFGRIVDPKDVPNYKNKVNKVDVDSKT